MPTRKKVLAICGSTRAQSTNLDYIRAIINLTRDQFQITIYNDLASLPHFNPDLDNDHPPLPVIEFRKLLRSFDGILICTPEYAMGVPGSLKNAIDWTVSSMEFAQKPTALITASSMGQKGHESLLGTLRIIMAGITEETQLLIPFAKTKINKELAITNPDTMSSVSGLLDSFDRLMNEMEAG